MRSSLKLTSSTKIGKEELRKIKIILTSLSECNDSFDFREPVDWKGMGLTDYPTIIHYPMDLSTVAKRLKQEKYSCLEEFLDDVEMIWDNCKTYNPDNSWIHSISEKLERTFKKMVKNYFPELSIFIPNKQLEQIKQSQGPSSLFEDDLDDVTYQQKLKFSEELSHLNSDNLAKIIDEILNKCPTAYKDLGNGKGQILVDFIDLIFFNQISLYLRNLKENQLNDPTKKMEVEKQTSIKSGKGKPINKIGLRNNE